MGGVNFTRNRAWWHTVIWDEYNQRHQYLMILPTFALLIPYYWHGAFLNRDLEQNFAAKMYALDYEQKRNRLTHNLIMEHFETHVEKVDDILDEIKMYGFEQTFSEEINGSLFEYSFPVEMDGLQDKESWGYEKKAELNELVYENVKQNVLVNTNDYAIETRKKVIDEHPRRKYPGTPFKFLSNVPLSTSGQQVEHFTFYPELDLSKNELMEIKVKSRGLEGEEKADE